MFFCKDKTGQTGRMSTFVWCFQFGLDEESVSRTLKDGSPRWSTQYFGEDIRPNTSQAGETSSTQTHHSTTFVTNMGSELNIACCFFYYYYSSLLLEAKNKHSLKSQQRLNVSMPSWSVCHDDRMTKAMGFFLSAVSLYILGTF